MLLLVALLVCVSAPSSAQPVDPQIRSAARKLGVEGIQLFDRGDYAAALDKFDRANALVPAPTLGVRAARCLAKLGRLVEASERYLEVIRSEIPAGSQWVHRRAQKDAEKERKELLPLIPSLEIVVSGPTGDGITVLLDGRELPPELVGVSSPTDPGDHEVRARRADVTVSEKVTVAEAASARVELKLPPLPPLPPPPPPPEPGFDWQAWTWVAVGVGAGGLVAFGINGAIAVAQESDLEERCPARVCPPDAHGAADVYDATRAATTVGLVVGGVGLVAAATLLLLAPDDDSEATPADDVTAWIAPGGAGVRGRF